MTIASSFQILPCFEQDPSKRRLSRKKLGEWNRTLTPHFGQVLLPIFSCPLHPFFLLECVLVVYTHYFDYVHITNPTKKSWIPEYLSLKLPVLLKEKEVKALIFNLFV